MSQNNASAGSASALIPALVLFAALTLLLVSLMSGRPQVQNAAVAQVPTATATEALPTPTPLGNASGSTTTVALDQEKVSKGESSFQTICSACHGFNAMGIPGLGKPLVGSEFANSLTDEELVAFLIVGREVSDKLNTTGQLMPPRGGNPMFSDDDLMNIVQYIRFLNQGQSAATAVPTATVDAGPQPTATEWKPLSLGAFGGGGNAAATATPSS